MFDSSYQRKGKIENTHRAHRRREAQKEKNLTNTKRCAAEHRTLLCNLNGGKHSGGWQRIDVIVCVCVLVNVLAVQFVHWNYINEIVCEVFESMRTSVWWLVSGDY